MRSVELLVLAAGMGSRYGGLKQLDGIGPCGETLLDYAVFDALRAGYGAVTFVIRRDFEGAFRDAVVRRYEGRVEVKLAFQRLEDLPGGRRVPEGREKPWGTGHAIRAAREAVRGPFVSINADDFYGAVAYGAVAKFLLRAAEGEFAMAGYRLGDTLSPNGPVSRGVCSSDAEGWLLSVEELTALQMADGFVRDSSGREFSPEQPVSVNFWGFGPEVFGLLEERLEEFLVAEGASSRSEFYIPAAVEGMLSAGKARVRILPARGPWFGVTYREDRPTVAARLAELHRAGAYPTPLWQD